NLHFKKQKSVYWKNRSPNLGTARTDQFSSASGSQQYPRSVQTFTPHKGGVHDACKKHSVRIGRNDRTFGYRSHGTSSRYALEGSGNPVGHHLLWTDRRQR